jgi:hypothetical protein
MGVVLYLCIQQACFLSLYLCVYDTSKQKFWHISAINSKADVFRKGQKLISHISQIYIFCENSSKYIFLIFCLLCTHLCHDNLTGRKGSKVKVKPESSWLYFLARIATINIM